MNDNIDVSVYMLTYFHEKYVGTAIESVLNQKTKYRFELVISDDCSKDGTTDIIKEYQRRYPDIIRINCNEHNVGIPTNIYRARSMCRGRYITALSGDDYWIDDHKIEIETAFLDSHPQYVAAFNCVELRVDGSDEAYDIVPHDKKMLNREYTLKDYEACIPIGTHGFFMRNYFLTQEGLDYFGQARQISEFVDDAVDEVLILKKGPVYVLDLVSDAHRVFNSTEGKNNYNSRYSRLEKFRQHIELLNGMDTRWGEEIDFSKWYANYCATGFLSMMLSSEKKEYKKIFASIPKKYRSKLNSSIYLKMVPFIFQMIGGRIKRM